MNEFMTLEDFNNLASGIQSILVGIAVLVGGGWTLFRFFSLKEIKKAKAELEKTKRDLQKRGHLEIEMTATEMFSSDFTEKYIYLSLNVKNVGNYAEVIRWKESTVSATPIRIGANGNVELGNKIQENIHSRYFNLAGTVIDPGISMKFTYLIPVENSGVYYLESTLAGSPTETAIALERSATAGINEADVAFWGSEIYFSVSEHD